MKALFFVFLIGFLLGDRMLSKTDAEKILGQPVALKYEENEIKNDLPQIRIAYAALPTEKRRRQEANLYCTVTNYRATDAAKSAFNALVKSNRDLSSYRPLQNIGNEALYHTDHKNFCYLLVRKNGYLIAIKVNKINEKFSFDALQQVAERIANGL